jgi:chemotaxis-related protein WspD
MSQDPAPPRNGEATAATPDRGAEATPDRGAEATPDRDAEARAFFDRSPPEDYLEEWASRLAQPPERPDDDLSSFVVFRLESEWLALPAGVFVEVTDPQPIHSVPHRTNGILLGMINIRGQLRLAVSLHGLFEVEPAAGADKTPSPRLLILRDGGDQWAFQVEEVAGIQRLAQAELRAVPSTFLRANTHTRAVFDRDGRTVGILDPDALFTSLRSHCR